MAGETDGATNTWDRWDMRARCLPQALQTVLPSALRRQRGVLTAPQLEQTCCMGGPEADDALAGDDTRETESSLTISDTCCGWCGCGWCCCGASLLAVEGRAGAGEGAAGGAGDAAGGGAWKAGSVTGLVWAKEPATRWRLTMGGSRTRDDMAGERVGGRPGSAR
jgi:hypothetical protein